MRKFWIEWNEDGAGFEDTYHTNDIDSGFLGQNRNEGAFRRAGRDDQIRQTIRSVFNFPISHPRGTAINCDLRFEGFRHLAEEIMNALMFHMSAPTALSGAKVYRQFFVREWQRPLFRELLWA